MICRQCNQDKELNNENWKRSKSTKTGFMLTCKACCEANDKQLAEIYPYSFTIELMEKKKYGKINATSEKMAKKSIKVLYPSWNLVGIKPLSPKNYYHTIPQ
jgi:hypothetical protein